jgi:hypothetical protein
MRKRPVIRFHPGLDPLEPRRPLSGAAAAAPGAHRAGGVTPIVTPHPGPAPGPITPKAVKTGIGFLVYRITNPGSGGPPNTLKPPFGHVFVGAHAPIPGRHYNILEVALKNMTQQTFDASSGFFVRLPYQNYTPILTGNETWKPGQDFIFYTLTKKYYPLANQVTSGFQFLLAGGWSTAIPGPAGIFLRIKYEPDTINKILDYAATRGPGAESGAGLPTGMADTAIYAFVSAKQKRNDFGGYF